MPLVSYSSDSSSDERPVKKARTACKLPPLPAGFRDLYATPVRASKQDDPVFHAGRQRVNPHIEGNWPTHIYTEWNPTTSQRQCIQELINLHSSDKDGIHDLLQSDLGVPAPLHISLSQSLSLTGEQRQDFPEELKANIEQTGIASFNVLVFEAEWVSNFTGTRWFLVLHIRTVANDDLSTLLDAANRIASLFGQKTLYSERNVVAKSHHSLEESNSSPTEVEILMNDHDVPLIKTFESFHVSIAWTLSKPSLPEDTTIKTSHDVEDLLSKLQIPVEAVKAKIGNNILSFPLKRPLSRELDKS